MSQVRQAPTVRGTLWATAGVEVTLCGWQVAPNAVERHASATATEVQLDAAALRRLAALACAYETDQQQDADELGEQPHRMLSIPALHAHDVFTGVMQLMGLERIVRVDGIGLAHIQPLAKPALDDVDVVHRSAPPFC